MPKGLCEEPAGGPQTLVVGGRLGQVGEEVAEAALGEPQPAAFGVAAEQDLCHGQADQLRVSKARRPAGASAALQQGEEVVDLDVECRDEGVELGLHTPLPGTLAFLVTACFPAVANSEALI